MIFNFCAENTIEGKLLGRLLEKLDEMREDLGGRVYDVVGEVLAHGGLDFERLLREALLSPAARSTRASGRSPRSTREALQGLRAGDRDRPGDQARRHELGRAARLALGGAAADAGVRRAVLRSRVRAASACASRSAATDGTCCGSSMSPERCATTAWQSVQRLGPPQDHYRRRPSARRCAQRAEHEDAVLLSPGHPLYAATVEAMRERLSSADGGAAPFIAPWATEPVRDPLLHLRGARASTCAGSPSRRGRSSSRWSRSETGPSSSPPTCFTT